MSSPAVTEQTLLEGAWWAMEQAGRLIGSAVMLYDAGQDSTASAIALFSREEIGRSRILRELADKVRAGERIEASAIRKAVTPHPEKQRRGASSTAVRNDPRVSNPLNRQIASETGSDEWLAADAELKAIVAEHAELAPDKRHRLRMAALYVDLDDAGNAWKLPRKLDASEVSIAVTEAINDYTMEVHNLKPNSITYYHPAMAQALERMTERPVIDMPARPERWPTILPDR